MLQEERGFLNLLIVRYECVVVFFFFFYIFIFIVYLLLFLD